MQTSRGCPWKCSFDASSILLTGRYKQKPVEKVLAEVDKVQSLWRRPFIEFADDNAFVNRAWWRQFLPELARRRVKWFAETDLSVAEDDGLLSLMRDAGCAEVLIGFESPVPEGLDGVELNRNWKKTRYPLYRRAIERIQSHGIRVNACFVVGLDGHGPDIFDALYDFVERRAVRRAGDLPDAVPRHADLPAVQAAGPLLETRVGAVHAFDINFRPTHMTVENCAALPRLASRRLYSDEFTKYRRDTFKRIPSAAETRPMRIAV